MSAFVDRHRTLLLALGVRMVGDPSWLGPVDEGDFLRIIDRAVADKPARLRAQLELFLFAIRWLPALIALRPFERLAPAHQERLLRRLQDAPLALVRKGFWGLRTLVFMGYYGGSVVR